jgi:hypothetical protein
MDLEDKTIICADCGKEFAHTAEDQKRYAERGFTADPKRCRECRQARKDKAAAGPGPGGPRRRRRRPSGRRRLRRRGGRRAFRQAAKLRLCAAWRRRRRRRRRWRLRSPGAEELRRHLRRLRRADHAAVRADAGTRGILPRLLPEDARALRSTGTPRRLRRVRGSQTSSIRARRRRARCRPRSGSGRRPRSGCPVSCRARRASSISRAGGTAPRSASPSPCTS